MPPETNRTPQVRHEIPIVVGLCLVSAILILPSLGDKSLWLDEGYSLQVARLPDSRFWDAVRQEPNMPLFYSLLHWITPLGSTEPLLRAISATAAILAVPVFYLLGRLMLPVAASAGATSLFVINPLLVRYGQEARGYALSILFATAATYLFLVALRTHRRWLWPLYAVAAAAAVYSQLAAILVIVAHAVAVPFLSARPSLRAAAFAGGATIVLLLPLALLFAERSSYGLDLRDFVAESTIGRLFIAVRTALPPAGVAALAIAGLVVPPVCAVVLLRGRSVSDEFKVALCWLLVPFWLAAVYSLVAQPVFVVRYFVTSIPALLLLLVMVVRRLTAVALRVSVLTAAIALSVGGLVHWYAFGAGEAEGWREAARYVAANADADDGILIFAPKTRLAFEQYFVEAAGPQTGARPVYPELAWGDASALLFVDEATIPYSANRIAANAKPFGNIWLILSPRGGGRIEVSYGALLTGLQRDFVAVSSREFGRVELVEYGKRP